MKYTIALATLVFYSASSFAGLSCSNKEAKLHIENVIDEMIEVSFKKGETTHLYNGYLKYSSTLGNTLFDDWVLTGEKEAKLSTYQTTEIIVPSICRFRNCDVKFITNFTAVLNLNGQAHEFKCAKTINH